MKHSMQTFIDMAKDGAEQNWASIIASNDAQGFLNATALCLSEENGEQCFTVGHLVGFDECSSEVRAEIASRMFEDIVKRTGALFLALCFTISDEESGNRFCALLASGKGTGKSFSYLGKINDNASDPIDWVGGQCNCKGKLCVSLRSAWGETEEFPPFFTRHVNTEQFASIMQAGFAKSLAEANIPELELTEQTNEQES